MQVRYIALWLKFHVTRKISGPASAGSEGAALRGTWFEPRPRRFLRVFFFKVFPSRIFTFCDVFLVLKNIFKN